MSSKKKFPKLVNNLLFTPINSISSKSRTSLISFLKLFLIFIFSDYLMLIQQVIYNVQVQVFPFIRFLSLVDELTIDNNSLNFLNCKEIL